MKHNNEHKKIFQNSGYSKEMPEKDMKAMMKEMMSKMDKMMAMMEEMMPEHKKEMM